MSGGDLWDPKAVVKVKQALAVIEKAKGAVESAESSIHDAMKVKDLPKLRTACTKQIEAHKVLAVAQKKLEKACNEL